MGLFSFILRAGIHPMNALQPCQLLALLIILNLGGHQAGAFGGRSHITHLKNGIPGWVVPLLPRWLTPHLQ